jgi:DNA repair exonuclease SbcCD nuclease subunit
MMAENTVKNEQEQKKVTADQKERSKDVITVVLTADNHLGYIAFGQHPRKREERQQLVRRAFQQATDFALAQGVDLFIQAGDLFDTTTPDEQDRSFVATHLAQLKEAGVRSFALGGVHDTPPDGPASRSESILAPQISYARLGALHYFPPLSTKAQELEPVIINLHGQRNIALCGLGVLPGQEGDPLENLRVRGDIELADIRILLLHAPIEGLTVGSSLLDTRAQVSRSSIANQAIFKYIFAGYHHGYSRQRLGQCEVIVAGATQHVDFSTPNQAPGFIFLGLGEDGIRWCNHIPVDALLLQSLVVHTKDLWPKHLSIMQSPTEIILEWLRPLCSPEAMIQLRLEGELTRGHYHQLDLNQIRRYGEEHCFALAIDDSALSLLAEQDDPLAIEIGERLSPREELVMLADEWIADTLDEQEKKVLQATKEELLLAIDEIKETSLQQDNVRRRGRGLVSR